VGRILLLPSLSFVGVKYRLEVLSAMWPLYSSYLGPSRVSCLLLPSLYLLSVSPFSEECLANVPRPPTVHVNHLDVPKMARPTHYDEACPYLVPH